MSEYEQEKWTGKQNEKARAIRAGLCFTRLVVLVPFCGLRFLFVVPGPIVVRWGRPVIFPVFNHLHRLLGRSLVLVFSLRKRARRNDPQHCYHHYLSHQPDHFCLSLLFPIARMGGRRDAPSLKVSKINAMNARSSEECVLLGKSTSRRRNSHGFELFRTLSCRPPNASRLHSMYPHCHSYRRPAARSYARPDRAR